MVFLLDGSALSQRSNRLAAGGDPDLGFLPADKNQVLSITVKLIKEYSWRVRNILTSVDVTAKWTICFWSEVLENDFRIVQFNFANICLESF